MTFIGFIGLGIMGLPMARNLQQAGYRVRATTRSGEGRERARSRGLEVVDSPTEAVDGASFVFTMLPDSADVDAVLGGTGGVIATVGRGTTVVDMSTIDAHVVRRLAETAQQAGVAYLDAPVSGGESAAVEGTLSIMVGGEAAAFEAAQPVLEAMGSTITHVGPAGAGQLVKAANQIVVAGNIQVLAEAMLFLSRHDIAADSALPVLAGGLAGSTVLDRKGAAMAAGRFEPGFRLALHDKDLRIVEAAARQAGASLPVTALLARLLQSAVLRGDGELDHGALLRGLAILNGAEW